MCVKHITNPPKHNIEDVALCRRMEFSIYKRTLNKNTCTELMVFTLFKIASGTMDPPTPLDPKPNVSSFTSTDQVCLAMVVIQLLVALSKNAQLRNRLAAAQFPNADIPVLASYPIQIKSKPSTC